MEIDFMQLMTDDEMLLSDVYWRDLRDAVINLQIEVANSPHVMLSEGDIIGAAGSALSAAWGAFTKIVSTGASIVKGVASGAYNKVLNPIYQNYIKPAYQKFIKPVYKSVIKPVAATVKKAAAKTAEALKSTALKTYNGVKSLASSAGAGLAKLSKNDKAMSSVVSGLSSVASALIQRHNDKSARNNVSNAQQAYYQGQQPIDYRNTYQPPDDIVTSFEQESDVSTYSLGYNSSAAPGGEALLYDFTFSEDSDADPSEEEEPSDLSVLVELNAESDDVWIMSEDYDDGDEDAIADYQADHSYARAVI